MESSLHINFSEFHFLFSLLPKFNWFKYVDDIIYLRKETVCDMDQQVKAIPSQTRKLSKPSGYMVGGKN